jgi:hypothetical protein
MPIRLLILLLATAVVAFGSPERLRLMVETDLGGDPDDEQSMVRFLLYASEWDVEGIIANRPRAREGENRNRERTGLGIARQFIDAYALCHSNLVQHDPRFPTPASLRARTVAGYDDVNDGVELLIRAVDSQDERPLWFLNWGTDHGSGRSCLKRALDQVRQQRGPEGCARFKSRLRLSSADAFGEHTFTVAPPFSFWVDTFRPEINRRRWYHQFSAITARAGGFDLLRDVLQNHGPLGALYPTNTTHWQKEGDTATFLYLIPTGMNDPTQPGWGSWAGRYGSMTNGANYYWANVVDEWNGTTNRNNTLARWAADLQNDFRARLDWCVGGFRHANHAPVVRLRHAFHLSARSGQTLELDASGSTDPDGHALQTEWIVYPEPTGYAGPKLSVERTGPLTPAPPCRSSPASNGCMSSPPCGTPANRHWPATPG